MSQRRLLSGLLFLAMIVAIPLTAAAKDEALDQIIKSGILKVAVPGNFPPFGDLGSDGKLNGYDIDTAALIAEALKVKLELIAVQSTDRISYLADGKVDLVISSLGKDAERAKLIDFSVAYAPFYSGVFGPQSLPVAKPADLAGKTIAVTRGTIEDAALTKLVPATATINRYDDNAATEIAFLASQAELIATGNATAAAVLAKSPMRKTQFKFLLLSSPCYIGVRKDEPDLLARVDAIISAARQDGRLEQISQHWLNSPLGDPEHPDASIGK
jgi:polar amino acid transport system substrate-binding protein